MRIRTSCETAYRPDSVLDAGLSLSSRMATRPPEPEVEAAPHGALRCSSSTCRECNPPIRAWLRIPLDGPLETEAAELTAPAPHASGQPSHRRARAQPREGLDVHAAYAKVQRQFASAEARVARLQVTVSPGDRVAGSFHLGRVGGSGRAVGRLNGRKAAALDRIVDSAVELPRAEARVEKLRSRMEQIARAVAELDEGFQRKVESNWRSSRG